MHGSIMSPPAHIQRQGVLRLFPRRRAPMAPAAQSRRPHTTDRIHARLERSDQTARPFFYRVRSVWCVSCSTICRDMFGTALRAPILASSLAAVLSSRSARGRTTYCVLVPIFFGCAGTYATVYVRKQLTTMHRRTPMTRCLI